MIKPVQLNATNRKYRRLLFAPQDLKRMAPVWAEQLKPIERAWLTGELSDANTACLYLLIGLEMRSPGQWLVGTSALKLPDPKNGVKVFDWLPYTGRLSQRLDRDATLSTLIHNFSLPGIRQAARETLLRWLNQELPLKLISHIPDAKFMLEQQLNGVRPVTAVFAAEKLAGIVHDDRDALSFFLHDLGHAAQFYANREWLNGQIEIYKKLKFAMDLKLLNQPSLFNPAWDDKLDYLIADLNTHPAHYMAVFWATARECFTQVQKEYEYVRWRDELLSSVGFQSDSLQHSVDTFAQ